MKHMTLKLKKETIVDLTDKQLKLADGASEYTVTCYHAYPSAYPCHSDNC